MYVKTIFYLIDRYLNYKKYLGTKLSMEKNSKSASSSSILIIQFQ
jgi:hypothetical protein